MKLFTTAFFISCLFGFSYSTVFAGNLKGTIKVDGEKAADIVVYLLPVIRVEFTAPEKPAVMDQINLNFEPHVLPVQLGTKVIFPNSDKIRHSVFSNSKTGKFDFGTYSPGSEKSIICEKAGVLPLLCYIHHDMSAYIVVVETPYFAKTDDDGEYLIKDIPSGKYKMVFWHEEYIIKQEELTIPEKGTVVKNINSPGV